MSTHDDNARDAGLTPEERALARRLGKLGPQGEPSPSIDAHILAAAHAAVRPTVHARRKVSKWPATFGMAASLAIACGIAWQLRPAPELPAAASVQHAEADEGVEYAKPPPSMSARDVPRRQLNMPTPPPAEQPAPRQRAKIRTATREDAQAKPQAFATESPIVLDEAVHPAPAAPMAPPPPAPPAQAMERAAIAGNAAAAADMAAQSTAPAAAKAVAAPARVRAEPEFAEPDEEVVPPATAESPAVRDAWLQRIRELVRDGQLDAARESLKAFRTRYPGHAIPDDLHAIEE